MGLIDQKSLFNHRNCENILQAIQLVRSRLATGDRDDNQIQTAIWKVASRHNYLEKVKSLPTEPHLQVTR